MKPITRLRSPVCYMIRKRQRIHYPEATKKIKLHDTATKTVTWTGAIHRAIGFPTLKMAETFRKLCIPPSEDVVIFEVHLNPVES